MIANRASKLTINHVDGDQHMIRPTTALPRLVLLPGLHGTADLYEPLLGCIPPGLAPKVIAYPPDIPLGYRELLVQIERELAQVPGEIILLAESFSGPLAMRYAARHPGRIRAIILSASFIRCPLWRVLPPIVKHVTRFAPPAFVTRWLMVGRSASRDTCSWVRDSIRQVAPRVLAHRLKQVARIDVSKDLERCAAIPMLYLCGTDDRVVRRASLDQILKIRPKMAIRTLQGPHMLLQVRPADSWHHVAEFLRSADVRVPVNGHTTAATSPAAPVLRRLEPDPALADTPLPVPQ
ncbi:MAG TPA: alpha/beta fold hydrolase [Tepidisphaeraceae bacterium]|jgi:pimeloyl-ACP methyl ester carboxylesterase